MQKKKVTTSGVVKVGRYNEATQEIKIRKGDTVEDVLDRAEIELSSSEKVWVDGDEAEMDDVVEAGDILSIVGKKSGGADEEETPAPTDEDAPTDEVVA